MTSHRKFVGVALAFAATLTAVTPTVALAQYDSRYDQDQVRRDYDARYGAGAYDRYYADRDRDRDRDGDYDRARRDYDARYGDGAYDRYYGAQADRTERTEQRDCRREKKGNQVIGGLLGGVAGAVLGSNLARGGGREGGAIIGGVGGAAAGATIANGQTHCDDGR